MRPLAHRNHLAMIHDVVMAGTSFVLSLYLRIGEYQFWELTGSYLVLGTLLFMLTATFVFRAMRLYGGIWQFASLADLMSLTKASLLVILVFFPLLFLFTRLEGMPRSVPFINWMLLLAMLGAPRFLYRFWRERELGLTFSLNDAIPILLIGATPRAELFLRDLERQSRPLFKVLGIVDSREEMIGRMVHRIRIMGGYDQLGGIIEKLTSKDVRPQKVVIADEELSGEMVQFLLKITDEQGIPLARLPRLTELKPGTIDYAGQIRSIAVEDLLGRPQAVRDRSKLEQFLKQKTVLITGAGGTIGGELTRQVASYTPRKLILFEASEHNLYQIDREMREKFPLLERVALLGDIRDQALVKTAFETHQPEIIFHAAAIKHVPLSEENPEEAVHTNVFGTQCIAEASRAHKAKAMVLISSDKAVNPANVMGTSKRLAERICQGIANLEATPTRFVTVRFGNVLGSTGSVVPLFQEQLAKGGPLTVTHPDIERYFMTVREAVELVILASAVGSEMDERGPIFVLDMGKPVKIADLARQMIRLVGMVPDKDIKIEYSGLRAGEKLYEELFYSSENLIKTEYESLMLASPSQVDFSVLLPKLEILKQTVLARDPVKTRKHLHALVPEYSETKPS